jgi:hypothetical protein
MWGNWRAVMAVDANRLRAELPSASSPNAQPIVTHAADVLDKVQSCMEKKPSLWKRVDRRGLIGGMA